MGKIYMIGAMKGGVGKSVSVFNLAYSLQKIGKRVLAVDMDPQSNLTTCFGVGEDADTTVSELMMAVLEEDTLPEREDFIWERNGVDIVPASIGLSAVEAKLRLEMGTERILSMILEPLRDEYDYILIDTAPSLDALNSELLPSERAVVLSERYEKISYQGRRNDIRREIEILNGKKPEDTCGHDVHKKSRDTIGEEYGMTGRNIARYMRVNRLAEPLKEKLDRGEISLVAAVDLSYLDEKEQEMVSEQAGHGDVKISPKAAKELREKAGSLEEGSITGILNPASGTAKKVSIKLPAETGEKFFSGKTARERSEMVVTALEAYFGRQEKG